MTRPEETAMPGEITVTYAPIPMTSHELAAMLHRLADAIASGDSLEGSFEYLLPGEETHEGDDGRHCPHLMVTAAFRTGNRTHGQGFMERIGEYREVPS